LALQCGRQILGQFSVQTVLHRQYPFCLRQTNLEIKSSHEVLAVYVACSS
jgi:hypothetical protein